MAEKSGFRQHQSRCLACERKPKAGLDDNYSRSPQDLHSPEPQRFTAAPKLLAALRAALYALDENVDRLGPSKQMAIAEAQAVIAEATAA